MLECSYEKLRIWQESMLLTKKIYEYTSAFPKEERYDLTSQMRRAAVSIPSNIAEGSQRVSNKDFRHFVSIAKGSLAELRTQIRIAQDLHYISSENSHKILIDAENINKMLYSFMQKLKTDNG
jgi:four helix bundle protein